MINQRSHHVFWASPCRDQHQFLGLCCRCHSPVAPFASPAADMFASSPGHVPASHVSWHQAGQTIKINKDHQTYITYLSYLIFYIYIHNWDITVYNMVSISHSISIRKWGPCQTYFPSLHPCLHPRHRSNVAIFCRVKPQLSWVKQTHI